MNGERGIPVDELSPTIDYLTEPRRSVQDERPTTDDTPNTNKSRADDGKVRKPHAKKSRRWEQQEKNKVYGYRLGADLHQLLLDAVAEYEVDGWHTTTSQVLRAWALAGWQLWLQGNAEVPGRPLESGIRGRPR